MKEIPFPQADDINKVFKIVDVKNEADLLNVKMMQIILGDVTSRQVQYYISAAQYLDIITVKKEFTEFGLLLRDAHETDKQILLSQKIVSKNIFGTVYFTQKVLGTKLNREEIVDIMKKENLFSSDEMYTRRAQTVLKWIEWINEISSCEY